MVILWDFMEIPMKTAGDERGTIWLCSLFSFEPGHLWRILQFEIEIFHGYISLPEGIIYYHYD